MGRNKDIAEILKEGSPLTRCVLEIEMAEGFIAAIVHCYG